MIIDNISDIRVTTEGGYQISVKYLPYCDLVEIWITNKDMRGTYVMHFNKEGRLVPQLIEDGITPEPTMQIFKIVWEGLKQAFKGLEKQPISQHYSNDGELAAIAYHLEDMRSLVFKNKKK